MHLSPKVYIVCIIKVTLWICQHMIVSANFLNLIRSNNLGLSYSNIKDSVSSKTPTKYHYTK